MTLTPLRVVVGTPAWLIVAGLAVVSAFHLAGREPDVAILVLIALTPWVYMAAWVTASFALLTHRRILAVCSLILVVLQLWWVVPDFSPFSRLASTPAGASTFSVFTENVTWSDLNLTGIAGEIRKHRPDLVALQEPNYIGLEAPAMAGALHRFHYKVVQATGGTDGFAIYCIYPLRDIHFWYTATIPQVQFWVELPRGRRLRVDVIHLHAPVVGPGQPALWESEMNEVRQMLAHEPRPLVALGDFGGTVYNPPFDTLLRLHLRDAADVAGDGWRMTWPKTVLPVVRIDHVLVSPTVSLEAYSTGVGQGTDHVPIMATMSIGGR